MRISPEEKAKQLIEVFSKQKALIAVTEILNALDFDFENPSEKVMYFLKVKIAIENFESK